MDSQGDFSHFSDLLWAPGNILNTENLVLFADASYRGPRWSNVTGQMLRGWIGGTERPAGCVF